MSLRNDMRRAKKTRAHLAKEELAQKTLQTIQRETALKWSWRGWAARRKAEKSRSVRRAARWLDDAGEYTHEGIEHAGLARLEGGGEGERFFAEILAIGRDRIEPIGPGKLSTDADAALAALAELDAKDLLQIQSETAVTWAWRAWAAYDNARLATTRAARDIWISDGKAYAEEAAEHASLAEEKGAEGIFIEILGIIRARD
jgi:hypothetical protein